MWGWGPAVQFCRFWGSDFCLFCCIVSRAWIKLILHRNPTTYLPLTRDDEGMKLNDD